MVVGVDAGISVRKLFPANPNNDRGLRTYENHLLKVVQCTTYYRNAGEVFGGHFHKGEDPSKAPEIFQLLLGAMEFTFTDKAGAKRTVLLDATDRIPIELLISPFLLHTARAITDVVFIEFRSTRFDPLCPDTYPEEVF